MEKLTGRHGMLRDHLMFWRDILAIKINKLIKFSRLIAVGKYSNDAAQQGRTESL